MSNRNDSDHDILMKQQVKLDQICASMKDLKDSHKDLRLTMQDGFSKLNLELKNNSLGCVTNRATCQKEISNKYVTTKMILFALTANTAILTTIGFVLKWTGVI